MRTTADYGAERRYNEFPDAATGSGPPGVGWVMFAAIMLGLAGVWNFFAGIAAIGDAHVYIANANYVFSDLNTWGWIMMILGVLQVLAGLALTSGSGVARWFGIVVAGVNALGQLNFVPAYPWWALSMFAIDILIIYGLAVYGGARLRAFR